MMFVRSVTVRSCESITKLTSVKVLPPSSLQQPAVNDSAPSPPEIQLSQMRPPRVISSAFMSANARRLDE